MKTDDLVAMLSTNVEPTGRGLVARTIAIAVAAGAALALGFVLVGLGVRADLTATRATAFLLLKVAFALAVIGMAMRYLTKLARPGAERGMSAARDCDAVCRNRAARRNQPWFGAQLALEQDGAWR